MSDKPKKPKIKSDIHNQVGDLKDKLARSLADYANLEKRIESQRQLYAAMSSATIMSKLLPVLDDLYLTQNHLKDEGLQIVINNFFSVLKSEGLVEIEADGKDFDPKLMDCIQVTQGTENKVINVLKKGYKLNDQVIRPVQVIVGKSDSN